MALTDDQQALLFATVPDGGHGWPSTDGPDPITDSTVALAEAGLVPKAEKVHDLMAALEASVAAAKAARASHRPTPVDREALNP